MYAQNGSYWNTTVSLARSKAELEEWVTKRGTTQFISMMKQATEDKPPKLLIRFDWQGEDLLFEYQPLPVEYSPRSDMDKLREKALDQMGRKALTHVKLMLQLSGEGHPEVLMPYMPAITAGGPTLQQQGIQNAKKFVLDANNGMLALPAPEESNA